jgi:hypothetical protein
MSSMTIQTFLKVATKLPNNITVLLRGGTGIGKSMLVHQLAENPVIDRRLSQMTEGDMVGLPSIADNVTRFNPPDWYKEACDNPRTLFLDELNRATPEVMQAAFQVVLDRELNGWKLHPQTRVFAAVNVGSQFSVNEMDPALLRRFWVVDLEPTVNDWLTYARDRVHPMIVEFIQNNHKFLDPAKNAEPGVVQPTRASWERLSQAVIHAGIADDPTDPIYYPMAMGFVGLEAAVSLVEFSKNYANNVTGDEILNKYAKVRAKVQKLGQERWNIAIEKLVDECNKLTALSDRQAKNIGEFMSDLPAELKVSLWSQLLRQGSNKIEFAKALHKNVTGVTGQMLKAFGVEGGEADKVPTKKK